MKHIYYRIMTVGLVVAPISFATACDDSSPEPAPSAPAVAEPVADSDPKSEPSSEVKQPGSSDLVVVSKDGSKFDPPVDSTKIPEGAWMCDMGTVHYAALEQGDGKCPECGMALKEKRDTTGGHDVPDGSGSSHAEH